MRKMNLPNKITLSRIILLPLLVVVEYIPVFRSIEIFGFLSLTNLLLLIIFGLCSFTDFLDGHIARKNNLVTTFGKFLDPLADKLLVLSTLLILLRHNNPLSSWIVIVILARELMVSGLRMLAAEKNIVMAAGILGKIKANVQVFMIIVLLLIGEIGATWSNVVCYVVMGITIFMTLWSGFDYMYKGRKIIFESF